MTEQLFTLDQARVEIAMQDCRAYGHQWQVIDVRTMDDPAGTPVEVQCTRCACHFKVSAPVVEPEPDPAPEEPVTDPADNPEGV